MVAHWQPNSSWAEKQHCFRMVRSGHLPASTLILSHELVNMLWRSEETWLENCTDFTDIISHSSSSVLPTQIARLKQEKDYFHLFHNRGETVLLSNDISAMFTYCCSSLYIWWMLIMHVMFCFLLFYQVTTSNILCWSIPKIFLELISCEYLSLTSFCLILQKNSNIINHEEDHICIHDVIRWDNSDIFCLGFKNPKQRMK